MDLKAVIIEDEKHSREVLKKMLKKFCPDIQVVAIVGTVNDGVEAIHEESPDIVFLDIELRPGTGFDVIKQIKGPSPEIIFTTAFEQYAIKAFKLSSLDYLLKPISVKELQHAILKARKKKNERIYKKQLDTLMFNIGQQSLKTSRVCLATAESIEFITTEEIIYCKADGAYTIFALKEGKTILTSKRLKVYERLLPRQHFMRVHNSFLINLKEVKKYMKSDGGYIIMNNGQQIAISHRKKNEFIKQMESLRF